MRASWVAASLIVGLLGVTGCSALDSSESVVVSFSEQMRETPGVLEVQATGQKVDPLSTEVDADITIDNDLTSDEVRAVMDRVVSLQRSSVSVSALLTNSWLSVPVTTNPEINRSVVDVAFDVAEESRVESVLVAMYMEDRYSVEVLTDSDPFELFSHVVTNSPHYLSLFVSTVEKDLIVSGNSTSDMGPVIDVARGILAADVPIEEMTVQPTAIAVTTTNAEGATRAEEVATSLDPEIAIDVSVAGDL